MPRGVPDRSTIAVALALGLVLKAADTGTWLGASLGAAALTAVVAHVRWHGFRRR